MFHVQKGVEISPKTAWVVSGYQEYSTFWVRESEILLSASKKGLYLTTKTIELKHIIW